MFLAVDRTCLRVRTDAGGQLEVLARFSSGDIVGQDVCGREVVCGLRSGHVCSRDLRTPKFRSLPIRLSSSAFGCRWLFGGSQLLVCATDGAMAMYDARRTDSPLRRYEEGLVNWDANTLAVSDTLYACATNNKEGEVRLWDLGSPAPIGTLRIGRSVRPSYVLRESWGQPSGYGPPGILYHDTDNAFVVLPSRSSPRRT